MPASTRPLEAWRLVSVRDSTFSIIQSGYKHVAGKPQMGERGMEKAILRKVMTWLLLLQEYWANTRKSPACYHTAFVEQILQGNNR